MTKEITMKEAVDEINRLNRERDALKQQLAIAERIIEFKDKVITAIETRAEEAEARADAAEEKIIKLEGQIDDAVAQIVKLSAADNRRLRETLEEIKDGAEAAMRVDGNYPASQLLKMMRAAIVEGKDEVREGGGE